MTAAERIFQTLYDEHKGNTGAALRDLAHRFAHVLQFVSPGYARWGLDGPGEATVDDPPNPITDEWVKLGGEA